MGVGTGAFGGAAGLAAGVAGAAGFVGVTGVAVFSGGVFTSGCTEPDAVAFTPPGTGDLSADGFGSPSGVGREGDLVSSGMLRDVKPTTQRDFGENVNFYQLESTLSTSLLTNVGRKFARVSREIAP